MTQFVDFVALGWVEKNLREEMDAAKSCLHRYEREPDEPRHLRDAQHSIHSATSALRLCALDPAALLTDEIERVLGQLHKGLIVGDARKLAMTELVAAIEALPAYLASVRAKREVTAGSIATVVNDLRHFGNRPPLPESLFFNPPIPEGAGISENKADIEEQQLKEFASRAMEICRKYSRPALERDHQALKRLYAVGKHAHPLLAGSAMEAYFRCYMGLIEVLAQSHTRPDEVIVDVLKHSFGFLKSLSTEGVVAVERTNPVPYIKKMLYYICKTPTPSALQKSLRASFDVENVEDFTSSHEGRLIQEDDLLDALGQTLQQLLNIMEFMTSRDQEICSKNTTLVESIVPQLAQVGVQLNVIGFPDLESSISEQHAILEKLSQQEEAAAPVDLVGFGGALVNVKEALEYKLKHGLSARGDGAAQDLDSAITEQVVRCLGDMKNSINREFTRQDLQQFSSQSTQALGVSIAGLRPLFRAVKLVGEPGQLAAMQDWEDESFPPAEQLVEMAGELLEKLQEAGYVERAVTGLDQVLSVLSLLDDKTRECEVLKKCSHYVNESVGQEGLVNDSSMACFAEALAALEQYLECRTEDPLGDSDEHLSRAEARAATLEEFLLERNNRVSPVDNIVELGLQVGSDKSEGQRDVISTASIVDFTATGDEEADSASDQDLSLDIEAQVDEGEPGPEELELETHTQASEEVEIETVEEVHEESGIETVEDIQQDSELETVAEDLVQSGIETIAEAHEESGIETVAEAHEEPEIEAFAEVSDEADAEVLESEAAVESASVAETITRTLSWRDALEIWIGMDLDRGPDAPLEDPEVDIDEELVECFVEEGRKHIRKLEDAAPRFAAELHNEKVIQEIRAIFHTMKGSARTIELNEFGEFMYELEKVFNALRDGYLKGTAEMAEFVGEVSTQLTPYVDLLMQRVPLYTRDFMIPAAIAAAMNEKRFAAESTLEITSVGDQIESVLVNAGGSETVAGENSPVVEAEEFVELDELEAIETLSETELGEPGELIGEKEEPDDFEVEMFESGSHDAIVDDVQSDSVDEIDEEFELSAEEDLEFVDLDEGSVELEEEFEAADDPEQSLESFEADLEIPAEPGEEIQDPTIAYSAEIWERRGAEEIMESVSALLAEVGPEESDVTGVAQSLVRSVVPALVELRNAEFLELSAHNLGNFLELSVLEHLASDAVFGLIATGDGEYSKIPISDDAKASLRSYLEMVNEDAEMMVPVHVEAEALVKSALSLPEDEEPAVEIKLLEAGSEDQGTSEDAGSVVAFQESVGEEASTEQVSTEEVSSEEASSEESEIEDIDSELLDLFIETMNEYTESIDASMVGLADGDLTALRGLKNTLHTVKGGANSIGLGKFGALIHEFESRLDTLEHESDVCSRESIDQIDVLVEGFNEAAKFICMRKADWDASASAEKEQEAEEEVVVGDSATVDPAQNPVADEPAQAHNKVDTLRIETHRIDRLLDLGLEISMSNVRCRHALDAATHDRSEVQGLARRVLSLVDKLSLQLDTEIQAKTEITPDGGQFDPLEMDRMTEKQNLAAILREAAYDLQEKSGELGLHVDSAVREAVGSSRLLQTNQSEMRLLRLVSFSKLGPGFRRLVHQVSRQLGKQVEFEFTCGEGGLDITVFERLKIALEHMLRNSIGHGIGIPEERSAQGKGESGNVKLLIMRQGSEFVIRLLDDGNGIDPENLRKKALEQGLIDEQERLTDEEALRLVFRSGLSTAEAVTDVSGRGVGMDVVYQSVTQVGGSVEIQSKFGFYTQFDIRVPASIMVNGALLATVGEEQIAIPLTSLVGSDFRRRDDVHREACVRDGRISFRGEEYQLRYLGRVRGSLPVPSLEMMPEFVPVLFAEHERRRVAFFVDALDNAEEMMIRSLGAQFTGVPGIAGGAVKSDGQPVLALDLNEFIGQVDYSDAISSASTVKTDSSTLVLCVDDSVMMRRTYEKRLQSLGYKVVTAVDGEEALDYLSQAAQLPDFIFTDLEMPNMNGFDFIANLRRVPNFEHIPTVVVSSRDAEKHRSEAQRVGATDFMAKGANSADGMQAIIQRHLHTKAMAS